MKEPPSAGEDGCLIVFATILILAFAFPVFYLAFALMVAFGGRVP